ncbi:anti-sigma factor [Jannaschia sp. S6380]|uniref:anti-sigma factor n=1 Tax=Jannaschia sp. S6380 TaxID=2926408 RepID=UPI001FF2D06A|nr:anti-sigma factor [Jannaschia sp. S6380]MCK0167307.1 anti-sigma factor [Jannaschia sp. S6380]
MTDTTDIDDDDALIGEYVLGLLDPDEAAEVERRLPDEPALSEHFRDWIEITTPMLVGRDVAPPPRLRARIEERLFEAGGRRRRWVAWGALLGGPVAAFAVAFLLLQPSQVFAPDFRAEILAEDATLRVSALADDDELRVTRLEGGPRSGRALEVWLIAGEAAPLSLGLLPDRGTLTVALPPSFAEGAVLAISDEPPGGSPTGAPTGDVLAVGAVTAL